MDLLHEDLKKWGRWSRNDRAPTRPPRCPLGRIAITSQVWESELPKPISINYADIAVIDLAVKKVGQIDRILKLILAAYYQYQISLRDERLRSPDYFNCSQRTIYNKFNRAKSLVSHYVNIS